MLLKRLTLLVASCTMLAGCNLPSGVPATESARPTQLEAKSLLPQKQYDIKQGATAKVETTADGSRQLSIKLAMSYSLGTNGGVHNPFYLLYNVAIEASEDLATGRFEHLKKLTVRRGDQSQATDVTEDPAALEQLLKLLDQATVSVLDAATNAALKDVKQQAVAVLRVAARRSSTK